MDDDEFLEDRRRALKESIEYFSGKNKPERERWVCAEFLGNLGIEFDDGDVLSSVDQPPDVLFRDARFEIKEVLDPGRRRHEEYKAAHEKALEATDPQDLLEPLFEPKDITPLQLAARIRGELDNLARQYAPAVRATLDLLFYVNLQDHSLKSGPMPEVASFSASGWRSISGMKDGGALVFFADTQAPAFLPPAGTLIQRKKFG